jgi:5'-methylthioadenosine phosphorylase
VFEVGIYFLPRHGRSHNYSPTNVPFRANIDALKRLGCNDVISISAVGSLKESLKPGMFVLVDQFIDRTFARKKTFFEKIIVAHVSMAKPICIKTAELVKKAAKKTSIDLILGGTYLAMEGPQFSSYAESMMYRSWHCDVIGMTNMPEAKLAREAEMRYVSIAMVTDYDCWHETEENVDVTDIIKVLNENAENAQLLLKAGRFQHFHLVL